MIEGREGYIINVYLSTYQGSTQIAHDLIFVDEYPAKEDIIYVGTQQR